MKLFKLFVLALLLSAPAWAQTPQSPRYRNDLVFLKQTLEQQYPSLYRFQSRSSIDSLFEDRIRATGSSTTEIEFYRTLKLVLSYIQDGHLGCSAPDALLQQIDEQEKHFPLSLYFSGQKAYVDCSNLSAFPPGTEITRINGSDIPDLREELFKYIVSDGKINTKKYRILNRSFWFYYSLVYGHHQEHEVTYKNSKGELVTTTVPAAQVKDMACNSLVPETADGPAELEFLPGNIALLTIRTFAEDALQNADIDFAAFLDRSFKAINAKKISSLIIDLRGNGGGRDAYGALLYAYLSDKPFRYYEQLETVSKIFDEKEHPNLALQLPKEDHFDGKVIVLIDGLSFSATSEFCTVVKNNDRAVFVGEETGGTYCGNTSGEFIRTELPYSRFTVFIPTTKYTMVTTDKTNTERGIIPDLTITTSIEDLLRKKDVPLRSAIELATKE